MIPGTRTMRDLSQVSSGDGERARADRLRTYIEDARKLIHDSGPFTSTQLFKLGERFDHILTAALQNDRPSSRPSTLTDEERERLFYICQNLEGHLGADPDGSAGLDKDVAYLRTLAGKEQR